MQNYCFSLLNAQTCFCRRLVVYIKQAKTTLTTARQSSDYISSRFCNHFPIISIESQYAFAKWVVIILIFNWDHHFTEKKANICLPVQAIERRGKGKNGCKMYKM